MPIRRVTISMPEKLARRVEKAAGKQPVSAWIRAFVERHLEELEYERLWQEHYAKLAITDTERERAAAILERAGKRRRRAA